jgi:hypothetical protein
MFHPDIRPTQSHERRGVARRAPIACIAGVMLALASCAADSEPTGTAGERGVIERAPEILGELETRDGAKLTFRAERERGDDDREPVVAITELAPRGVLSYLARLRDLRATSLEAFLALAPAGTEAPVVLREAHAREAAVLGRSTELRVVSLDAATALVLPDHPMCDSYPAFTNAIDAIAWTAAETGSSTENHSITFDDGGNVQAFVCNDDDADADIKIAKFCYDNGIDFVCDSGTVVADGNLVTTLWVNATTARQARATKLNDVSVMSFIGIANLPPQG